jgi:hypothetical protein
LVIGAFALAHGNVFTRRFDDSIYKSIQEVLTVKYPDEQKLVKCMVDDFRGDHIVDKFFSEDLLTDTDKLTKAIEKYENSARIKCKIGIFLESPFGVLALVVICLIIILISCCVIKCIWC